MEAIYKLKVKTDQSKIKSYSYEENKKLLWHGTKPENLIGILTNGLLINAPYSQITGRSLGEGLYLGMIFKIETDAKNYCPRNRLLLENPQFLPNLYKTW